MKRDRRTCILFILMLSGVAIPGYASMRAAEEKAQAYFDQQEYGKAVDVWQSMVDAGQATTGVYYNIGVAESLLQHVPAAILAYEHALRLSPLNPKIKKAILEERKKIENATIPIAPFFLKEWYKGLLTLFRPGLWSLIGLALLGVGLISVISDQLRKAKRYVLPPLLRRWMFASGIACILLAGLSYKEIYREDEAILMERGDIRQAATEASPGVRTLYPGEKIRVTDVIGDWYHVELLNLDNGWIRKEHLQFVRIQK